MKPTRFGPTPDQAKDGFSALSGSPDVVHLETTLGKNRGRYEDEILDLTVDGSCTRSFSPPPCFVEKDFFEGYPLTVSN